MRNIINKISVKALEAKNKVTGFVQDKRGDLATNTIGAIIVAVVIVGLLIAAVNAFFPNFFSSMFSAMSDKLNKNW